MTTISKGGRPTRREGRSSVTITLRATEEERDELDDRRGELSRSDFLRRYLFGSKRVSRVTYLVTGSERERAAVVARLKARARDHERVIAVMGAEGCYGYRPETTRWVRAYGTDPMVAAHLEAGGHEVWL